VSALERFEEAVKYESSKNTKFQTIKIVTPTLEISHFFFNLGKFKNLYQIKEIGAKFAHANSCEFLKN
jgi:hypothetical protein